MLIVEVVPVVSVTIATLRVRYVVSTHHRAMMHSHSTEAVICTSSQAWIYIIQAKLVHVQPLIVGRVLLNLPTIAIETLDMEDQHLGKLDESMSHFRLRFLPTALACVKVVDVVFGALILKAF